MRRITGFVIRMLLLALALLVCMPVVLLLSGSITDAGELREGLSAVLAGGEGYLSFHLLPDYPSLASYGKLFFLSPQYFVLFWNSLFQVLLILGGQLLVAVPAAWIFAVYPSRQNRMIFMLYIILMLLPFQVTMLPSYLVLNRLGLINTRWAVVLPAVFSTFPVFLIYRSFTGIPRALLEAARIDGAGEWKCFWHVGLPLGSSGILAAMILGFLEYWNMIEQPLSFLKDRSLWPLSLYLPEIGSGQEGFAFAASVLTILPAVFVFLLGQDYLEQGIAMSGMKE